jgi:pyruvate carboxylase subunit A
MIEKVLVANRGEIAIRIMRACRELGIFSCAVYSDADSRAIHARYADEAFYIGGTHPLESYLNIEKIIGVAKRAKADAIHPGYGFLAENPAFAAACEDEGIKFIGPSASVIELMGNKVEARKVMQNVGVPITPGSGRIEDMAEAKRKAEELSYPVIVKASAGGGGIGMKIVEREAELTQAILSTQDLALSTFGDKGVFLEKYIKGARHIEFQVLADNFGNVVHLGERECSIQRRHQKLIEESPSPVMTESLRERMGEIAIKAAQAVGYENAGTVEFIYKDGSFYFCEMNTRVQVEHPVTEQVTGIDIVKEQIRIARGEPLSFSQEDIKLTGWAIECRINAEDPLNNFLPSPQRLRGYRSPGGIGVRVDSGVHTYYSIPPSYDPMISKLVVWGRDRKEAIDRMKRALYEYIIVGPKTNICFHKAVMENEAFIRGDLSTHFLEEEKELFSRMERIAAEEKPLSAKLSEIFKQDAKMAVAAVAAEAYVRMV